MAIDEWLLEQHRLGRQPSILRFYTWNPPAISLGYHQRRWESHWSNMTWKGQRLDLVRRPTGGRAVLHQGDLTYAVISSNLSGRRAEIYRTLCQFLIEGWRSLGIPLHYGQAGRGYIHNPNCFGTATAADLVLPNGTKLIGSAQLRRQQAILQHGSMRLRPDPLLFEQVFGSALGEMVLPLRSPLPLTGESLEQQVIAALTTALQQHLDVRLVSQPLSAEEWQAVGDRASRWTVNDAPVR